LPHDAVHPAALDRPLSLQLESKFDEELGCGREVVNHDADVLHPFDRHVLYGNESRFEPQRQAPEETRSSREIFFESGERDPDRQQCARAWHSWQIPRYPGECGGRGATSRHSNV
jgi:hypothetical protein